MEGNLFKGDGVVILVSYTGKISGRMIINIPEELGIEIHNILTEDDKTQIDDDVLITMNEFGNMVAGNAITHVNNKYRGYNIRLAPPSSFSGKDLMFFNFKMDAYNVVLSDGKYKINYNVAFKEDE
nr:chemotaxis protein CheX [Marinitoga sp. 1138]